MTTVNATLGHNVTGYFLTNANGFMTAIGASRGLDEGFFFISNVSNQRTITNMKDMSNFILHREGKDYWIVDSEGNILTREELFDFAAYSRYRSVNEDRIIHTDNHGFKFATLKHSERQEIYATVLL